MLDRKIELEKKTKSLNTKVFYDKGKYALTYNPCDQYQYFGQSNRLVQFKDFINETFVGYPSKGIHYELYIELSEPRNKTRTGPRLHIHGTLKFHSKKAVRWFLLIGFYQLLQNGILDLDTINNQQIWDQYCKKQQHIINVPPITNKIETLKPEPNRETKE